MKKFKLPKLPYVICVMGIVVAAIAMFIRLIFENTIVIIVTFVVAAIAIFIGWIAVIILIAMVTIKIRRRSNNNDVQNDEEFVESCYQDFMA